MSFSRRTRWYLISSVFGLLILAAIAWFAGPVAAFLALSAFALARIPNLRIWIEGRWHLRRLHSVSSQIGHACLTSLERDFPFVRPAKEHLWTDVGAAHGFVDWNLADRLAAAVVEGLGSNELTTLVSQDVLKTTILHRAEPSIEPSLKPFLRKAVSEFMNTQIRVTASKIEISDSGDKFLRLLIALDHGPLTSYSSVAEAVKTIIDEESRNTRAFEIADPRITYLVTQLGKEQDLHELFTRQASARRVLSFLHRREARQNRPSKATQYFLVLKEEYRKGRQMVKERIDSFPERLTATGWLYSGSDVTPFQSISILPSPIHYRSARSFLERHFPEMKKLTKEEGRRTAVLAVPLDLGRAYSLPVKASSTLYPTHARFFENWRRFFGLERPHRGGEAAPDFDVTLAELVDHLTIDFLIKNPASGEVAFLRKNSAKILKRLGLVSIFELRQVKPSALVRVASEFGYPSYSIDDFERLSTDTSVSLVHWLRGRLGELAKTAIRTANRTATLRDPA